MTFGCGRHRRRLPHVWHDSFQFDGLHQFVAWYEACKPRHDWLVVQGLDP